MKALLKASLLMTALAFAAALQANDLVKALDSINKMVDGTSAPGVKSVVVGTGFANGAPSGVAAAFPPSVKRIYACYTAAGATGNVQIQAVWLYGQDASSMAKIASSSDAMAKSGSVGEFHLEVPSGKWPAGQYKVELLVRGKSVGEASFQIDESLAASGSGAVWNGGAGNGSVWNGGASQSK